VRRMGLTRLWCRCCVAQSSKAKRHDGIGSEGKKNKWGILESPDAVAATK
jgi:hypothetical protein